MFLIYLGVNIRRWNGVKLTENYTHMQRKGVSMTKKERVLNAMNNRPVDKIPAGFWFHFPPEMDLKKECVEAHLDFYREYDTDFIKIMCDGYFDYPNPAIPHIRRPKDWYQMKPMGGGHPFILEQVERAAEIVKRLNGECCTFYNVFCPMSFLRFGTSEQLLMAHIKEDPDAVMYAMDVAAQDAVTLSSLLITEAGCDGIYYCVQNAEENRFSAEEYRRLVRPAELKVLEAVNQISSNNILHCCGWAGDKNRIEVWQDYPAKVINWAVYVENMTMKEGKDFFGGKCVLGGFDNRPQGTLCSGTREEIREFTAGLIQETGTLGFMAGADCTLPRDINKEHIKWVTESIRELRQA